jgi:hypothetical protein
VTLLAGLRQRVRRAPALDREEAPRVAVDTVVLVREAGRKEARGQRELELRFLKAYALARWNLCGKEMEVQPVRASRRELAQKWAHKSLAPREEAFGLATANVTTQWSVVRSGQLQHQADQAPAEVHLKRPVDRTTLMAVKPRR